jgi:hypothetical protein
MLGTDAPEEDRFFGGPRTRIESDLRGSTAWRLQGPEPAMLELNHGMRSLITAPLHTHGGLIGVVGFWRSDQAEPYREDDLATATELVPPEYLIVRSDLLFLLQA